MDARLAWLLAASLWIVPCTALADDPFTALVRPTEPLSPEEEQTRLRVPAGFEIRLFAAEPQINKPINIAFDDRGRLWVTSNTEYPFPAAKDRWVDPQGSRVRDSRDCIKILEDTTGDGRADRVTTFIDGLNIPIGILPYGNGCIAWSIPNIWYLEDTDGDDRCDRQTVLFGPLGYERDTHGNIASLRLGDDGWVYATHGFANVSRFEVRPERLGTRSLGDPGTVLELASGNVFRFRPDGSEIELWSRGQVNPFGLAFDGWGNLYSADCHSDPVTQLLRGASYPSFGRPHDGLGFGPVMCPHRHGSTGLCGLVYLHGDVWGREWDNRVLIGNCVTSRVNHDRVEFRGSTAVAHEEPDFVVSEDPWFRPVDLRLGPDGALYIADFYNRIIGHYEVDLHHPGRDRLRGRIWRVVPRRHSAPAERSADELAAAALRKMHERADSWTVADYNELLAWAADDARLAHGRRIALEGLALAPRPANLPHLLPLLETITDDDPALRHTLRIALRQHLAQPAGLAELDRLVSPATASSDLAGVLRAVPTAEAAGWLLTWLDGQSTPPDDLSALLTTLARWLRAEDEAALVELARARFDQPDRSVLPVLQALRDGFAQRGGRRPPALQRWAAERADQLLAAEETVRGPTADEHLAAVAELARTFQLVGLAPRLAAQLSRGGLSDATQLELAMAVAQSPQAGSEALAAYFKTAPSRLQTQLAEVLASTPEAAHTLCDLVPPRLLTVPGIALRLAAHRDEALNQRVRELTANLPPAAAELDQVIAQRLRAFNQARNAGRLDPAAGQQVFARHCAACHRVGDMGKTIAPQLDGLHNRGAERLCEDILDPNRAVDPQFRMQVFELADGTVAAGLLRREQGDALVLVDQAGREQALSASDIVERNTGNLSLMPTGFDKLLSESEFTNLLAWLLAPR